MKPNISVIIPVYKTENVIGRCLDSLLSQTFQDFEIVIVNDCTPDNAMRIVEKYTQKRSNFKIVQHSENQGLMVARRNGYLNASGEYYVFLDSDDTLTEDALEILYQEVTSNDADIIISGYRLVWPDDKVIEKLPLCTGEFTATETFHNLLQGKLTHNLAFCIFKAELFNHDYLTLPNQTNGEDLILFYQLVANCKKIKSIPRVTYNYFQDTVSSTRSVFDKDRIRQVINVQYFKISFLSKLKLAESIYMRNVMKIISRMYKYPEFNADLLNNNDIIRKRLNPISLLKYLTLKEYCSYLYYRLKALVK